MKNSDDNQFGQNELEDITEDQYISVPMDELDEKRQRCNIATWLQIFGAIGAVGGGIAIKVASGLWSKVSGICVAIGGIGMSIFGFLKINVLV